MTDYVSSYGKIWALGHKATARLFEGSVVVEEKIDGSQISWRMGPETNTLTIRSKGAIIDLDTVDKLFKPAVETIRYLERRLTPGWTYRGEAMCGPRHNTLKYERAPHGGVILFDVDRGIEDYLPPSEKKFEASRLGLECAPLLGYSETGFSLEVLRGMLAQASCLGGSIEGIVLKNYAQFGPDGKVLMAKLVRDEFKETHRQTWNAGKDIVGQITAAVAVPARWQKAVQHLRDAGTLEESPRDIGPIIKEVQEDLVAEYLDNIKESLWTHYRRQIMGGATRGLPEWYKAKLLAESGLLSTEPASTT